MNESTPATPIPILKDNELRLSNMRRRLEDMFTEIHLVRDVIIVSIETISTQKSDFDPEVSRVLTRCGADKLHRQLKSLTNVIEQLGGRTDFTDRSETSQGTQAEASSEHHDQ